MSPPDPLPHTIVVTGAGGFVGSWLSRVLSDAGASVRGVGRHAPAAGGAGTFYQADLLDRGALRPALAGAAAVVHLAARVHVMRDTAADRLAEFRRVNVEGTQVLLEEARRAGLRCFVFASTVKAVAESSPVPLDDQAEPRPVDPYGISKLEAERLVAAEGETRGVAATILRLPLVYGPGMKGNMLSLFRLVDRSLPLPLGLVDNRRSLAFVGNVAAAILAALRASEAAGPFFVSDGRDLSTPDLVRAIAAALRRPACLLPVPPALFRVAGRIGDVISRVRPVPLTSAAVERLVGSLSVDSSGIRRTLGYRPPYTVEEGLGLTAEWYRVARS